MQIALTEVLLPQVGEHLAGVHPHFIGFVVNAGVGIRGVKPAIAVQFEGVVLVGHAVPMDHQLRQGEGFTGFWRVLPTQKGLAAAGRDIVEAMPPDLIGVPVGDAVFLQDFTGYRMGFLLQTGAGCHNDRRDEFEFFLVGGIA